MKLLPKYVVCIKYTRVLRIQVILRIFCISADHYCGHSAGAMVQFNSTTLFHEDYTQQLVIK